MNEELQKLHTRMMDQYFDEGGSIGGIASEHGRSESLVNKLIRLERRRGRVRTKETSSADPRLREHRKTLSMAHWMIGVRVARYRARANISQQDFGLKVSLSRVRVGELESGSYDITLGEIQRIADLLDMTLEDIMSSGKAANAG